MKKKTPAPAQRAATPVPQPPSYGGQQLLSIRQVVEITALSRSTIYELITKGKFPKARPYRDVPGRKYFDAVEVGAWVDRQLDS